MGIGIPLLLKIRGIPVRIWGRLRGIGGDSERRPYGDPYRFDIGATAIPEICLYSSVDRAGCFYRLLVVGSNPTGGA